MFLFQVKPLIKLFILYKYHKTKWLENHEIQNHDSCNTDKTQRKFVDPLVIFSHRIKLPTEYSCWIKPLWKEQWLISIFWMMKNSPEDGIATASTTSIEKCWKVCEYSWQSNLLTIKGFQSVFQKFIRKIYFSCVRLFSLVCSAFIV